MKPQKSKPLLILESDPEIDSMFEEMNSEVEPFAEKGQQLLEEIHGIKNKINEVQSKHWTLIEKKLIERGLIDSKDVSLSVRDGVLYMDPKNQVHNLADLFGKLFE